MSYVINIGALAIAALALAITYRERTAALRSSLYAKQIESYGSLIDALATLSAEADLFIIGEGFKLDADGRARMRVAVGPAHGALGNLMRRAAPFLPNGVADEIAAYSKTLLAISAMPGLEHMYDPALVSSSDPQAVLYDAYGRVIAAMRRHLGTDPLAEQTLRLLEARGDSTT